MNNERNLEEIKNGNLTEDNRLDKHAMVLTMTILPPAQKGMNQHGRPITSTTELRVLNSTKLEDIFDKIHCPTSKLSTRHGSEFAKNPGKHSREMYQI